MMRELTLGMNKLGLGRLGGKLRGQSLRHRMGAFVLACATPATFAWAGGDFSAKPICKAGKLQCVNLVVAGMDQQLRKLAKDCDHNSIFALGYLRTTEKYRETAETLGYDDVTSVTREDALFADYYFRAYRAYDTGEGTVPLAWQIAFDAAEAKTMPALGNAFLGFNAHIQRDLPFTLYDLYLSGHEVSEHDHFLVNEFLAQVEFAQEVVDRFDPTYPLGGDPQIIFDWRALAYHHFTLLRDAATPEQFEQAVQQIEGNAAATAYFFLQTFAYPPGFDSSARDAYCEENGFPE